MVDLSIIIHFAALVYRAVQIEKSLERTRERKLAKKQEVPLPPRIDVIPTILKPMASGNVPIFFEALAHTAAVNKRKSDAAKEAWAEQVYVLDLPQDANLRYTVHVKSRETGQELGPVVTYQHGQGPETDAIYSRLIGSFMAQGVTPEIWILNGYGMQMVLDEAHWEQIVLQIYNRRRAGVGLVEVEVLI